MSRRSGPNYFLTFRFQSRELMSKLAKVHEEFLTKDESLKNYIEPVSLAHITLNVLNIEPERLEELKNLIRETISKNQASFIPQGNLKLRGLGMFGESVLFAVPENEEYLQKVHEIFRDLFIQHDIWTEERSYTPHVTLFMAPGKNMNIQEADIGEK